MKESMGSMKFGKYGKDVDYSGQRLPNTAQQKSSSGNPVAQAFNALLSVAREVLNVLRSGVKISLPENVAAPMDSDSVDLRRLVNLPDGSSNVEIFRFKAPKGTAVLITSYGVFTDILNGEEFKVIPRVNGNRVLQYHGDPNLNFAINLSLGPDLTDSSLIPCQILLKPEQVLTVHASNASANSAPVGIRIKGHVDKGGKNSTGSFGG